MRVLYSARGAPSTDNPDSARTTGTDKRDRLTWRERPSDWLALQRPRREPDRADCGGRGSVSSCPCASPPQPTATRTRLNRSPLAGWQGDTRTASRSEANERASALDGDQLMRRAGAITNEREAGRADIQKCARHDRLTLLERRPGWIGEDR